MSRHASRPPLFSLFFTIFDVLGLRLWADAVRPRMVITAAATVTDPVAEVVGNERPVAKEYGHDIKASADKSGELVFVVAGGKYAVAFIADIPELAIFFPLFKAKRPGDQFTYLGPVDRDAIADTEPAKRDHDSFCFGTHVFALS